MNNEQNKPYPFAALLIFWLFGSYDEEIIKKYLKSLPAEKIDEIIEMVKETPVEDKYKETTINELLKCKNNSCDMITEDYCSFDLSKLLKEKGFDVELQCDSYYEETQKQIDIPWQTEIDGLYPHCTHALAMKWLREKHNIDIGIEANVGMLGVKVYTPFVSTYKSVTDNPNKLRQYKRGLHYKDDKGVVPALQHFPKYKEAVEAALKHCLTKVI